MGGPGSGRRKKSAVDAAVASVATPPTTVLGLPGGDTLRVLGDNELTPQDQQMVAKLQAGLKRAFIGNRNPMWNDEEELLTMASVGFAGGGGGGVSTAEYERILAFTGGAPVGGNANINDRFSKRHTVADMNIPRNPLAVIQLAMRYAAENPFVAKAAKVKTNFTVKNFVHKTTSKPAKKFYDDYADTLLLKTQLNKIVFALYTVGLAPIYWGGEEGGEIEFLQVLDPRSVHVEEILGRNKMWIKIDQAMIDAVKRVETESMSPTPQDEALYAAMPKYWIDQIRACIVKGYGWGMITLPDGCYAVVENRYMAYNRVQGTLDGVPLQGAFDALQRYRLLAAGDFAVAWNVKNMLTLISEGDPKADPKDYRPSDDLRLQKLQAQFANPDYALTIFCDPTTQVRYVIPPIEVFDPKKYKQCEKEIKEVLNLPSFMWSNDGQGTYGAAQAEVQLLRQEVDSLRMLLIEQFFRPFYKRLRAGSKKPGFGVDKIVMPQFDQNSLRDDTVWLSANADLYSRGAISLETLVEVFGYDFAYEMAQKAQEHKDFGNSQGGESNDTVARPLYEPSQGNMQPNRDKGGNEADPSSENHQGPQAHRNPRKAGK